MDDITFARVNDPGRGLFCAVTKGGVPINMPPDRREPIAQRDTNPQGVRHPFKTRQDYMPVAERPRVIAWHKRQSQ